MRTCKDCGHPTSRGWSGGRAGIRLCLICLTARVMKTMKKEA